MNATAAALRPLLMGMRILWAALLGASILFTVLSVTFPVDDVERPPTETLLVFVGLALGTAFASFIVPRQQMVIFAQRRRPLLAPAEPVPGALASGIVFVDPLAAGRHAFGSAQTGFLLSMALSEVPCLVGFALHALGCPIATTLPFGVLGIVLSASRFPMAPRLVRIYERVHGARFALEDLPR